jgi:RNA-binding protein YlmH
MSWRIMGYTSKGLNRPDDLILKAWIRDAVRLCELRSAPRFVGFLDERQFSVAACMLEPGLNTMFYGGYPDAERRMLGVFPEYFSAQQTEFPIEKIVFSFRKTATISHRDFLGAILSNGVKREKIGDILCADGLAVVFAEREIARFIQTQIDRVGGEGVTLLPDYQGELPAARKFKEIRDTVASPRLDAVVKVAAGLSREQAARRIEAGLVSVNHLARMSVSSLVHEKDIISIRGSGRYKIQTIGPNTRKGRLYITLLKYL